MNTKLKAGYNSAIRSSEPIIGITGTGRNTYLWIGNDAEDDKFCYATLSGVKTLEKLAVNILEAIKSDKLK